MNKIKKNVRHIALLICALLLIAGILFILGFKDTELLTPEERLWLNRHDGKLRLAPTPNYPPVDFFDENGTYKGIVADYIKLIEARLNFTFKLTRVDTWSLLLKKAKAGEVDVTGGAQQNSQRLKYFRFSTPILTLPAVIVTRKETKGNLTIEKMRGMKVAVVRSYAVQPYLETRYSYLDIHPVAGNLAALRMVSFSEVDAVIMELPVATYYLAKEGITNLRIAGNSGYTYKLRIASRKNMPILNRILQKGLDSITTKEREEIYSRWINLESAPFFYRKEFLYGALLLIGITLLISSLILFWNRTLRRRVAARTGQLNEELAKRKKSEEKYRSIFDHAMEGIFRSSLQSRFLTVNPAFAHMLGYDSPEDMIETITDIETVIYADLRDRERLLDIISKEGAAKNFELKLLRKDGSTIEVLINSREVRNDKNELLFYEGNVKDFTQTKRAQALKVANEEAEMARKAAEAANSAKSVFLANMSHEIRTPLNAVLGFAELLQKGAVDEIQKQYASSILAGGKTLLSLINDILDLSKIEAGKLELCFSKLEPAAVLMEIKEIFREKAKTKGVEIKVEIDETLPCYIVTDGIRLRQILFNLLGNAIKFTAKGTIKLAVRKCAENESNNSIDIAFSVEDTGIGIPAHQMGAVFDAFTQQKGQDPSKYGGTGLGLAITKRLVEIMAGTITIESEVGKGSTFKVTLKSVPTATVEHEPGSDNSHGIDNIRFDGAEVLVADDLDTNRLLIKKFLEPLGIRVREATDGKAAVDSARLHHPGVVVMDVRMPLMDGFEATQSIKNDDQLNDIAVIVLTASAMKSDEVAAQKSGADSYITKPVNYVQLVTQLQRFLPYTRGGKETADQLTETETVYTEKKTLSPGLPEALETELSDTWESIRGVYIFDDIDTFATRVIKLGEENSLEILTRWGKRLHEQVQTFDMERLPETLDYFPQLMKKIEQAGKGN